MRILVFGPGVIGTIFAGKLGLSYRHRVSVVGRGQRLTSIREHGLVLRDISDIVEKQVRVDARAAPNPDETYDLTIAALRADQIDAALPDLAALRGSGDILLMVNNPLGYAQWSAALGKRLLIGFPGAAGFVRDGVVHYRIVHPWLQATTLGEVDGAITPRLRRLRGMFNLVGIPTTLTRHIDAWQKVHVAWVAPLATAVYLAQNNGASLAARPDLQRLMIHAVREGIIALDSLGVLITPAKMNIWRWAPPSLLATIMRPIARSDYFHNLAVPHSMVATEEIRLLASDFLQLIEAAPVSTPHLHELYGHFIK